MIITKFGGSSLSGPAEFLNVIEVIKSRLDRKPLVVVSAAGDTTGLLNSACEKSLSGGLTEAIDILEALEFRHIYLLKQLVCNSAPSYHTENIITGYFAELKSIAACVNLTGVLTESVRAKALSYGELISSHILAEALNERGVNSVFADSREFIVTDDNFLNAAPLYDEIKVKAHLSLIEDINRGAVPVMQGFIGRGKTGLTTTLGRNGSDFTASVIGAALNAEEIEIWTDVNGILTADPKKIPGAVRINEISYSEAEELAYYGGEVLHRKTIYPAEQSNIPLRILNTRDGSNRGTLVKRGTADKEDCITTITYKEDITVLNIYPKEKFCIHPAFKLLEALEKYKVEFSPVNMRRSHICCVIEGDALPQEGINELEEFNYVRAAGDKALVTIIGSGLSRCGIPEKVFNELRKHKPEIVLDNPGGVSLSFVVERGRLDEVLRGLHSRLIAPPEEQEEQEKQKEEKFKPEREEQFI